MSGALIAVEFTEQHLALVQDFACGDESYERELADWIRTEAVAAVGRVRRSGSMSHPRRRSSVTVRWR